MFNKYMKMINMRHKLGLGYESDYEDLILLSYLYDCSNVSEQLKSILANKTLMYLPEPTYLRIHGTITLTLDPSHINKSLYIIIKDKETGKIIYVFDLCWDVLHNFISLYPDSEKLNEISNMICECVMTAWNEV